MSEIAINWIYSSMPNFFIWVYLLGSKILGKLLFYPVGIVVTLYVVFWINFFLIKAAKDIIYSTKILYYNLIDIYLLIYSSTFFFKFILSNIAGLYKTILNILRFYSKYYFIFFLKRVEMHFFWISLIIIYC